MNRARIIFMFPIVVACLTGHALGGNAGRSSRSQNRKNEASSSDIIPGVVVVKFKRTSLVTGGQAASGVAPLPTAFAEQGVTSLARAFPFVKPLSDADVSSGKIDLSQIHFAAIPSDLDPRDVASQLAQLPQVEYAEPKYYSYLCDVPNDSDYPALQQVYFDRMNVAAGWALQKGSPSVIIATVDGGTNWKHPDLLPNIWINPGEDVRHDGIFEQYPAPAGDLNGIDDDGNGFTDDVIGWNFSDGSNNPLGFLSGNANHGTETASVFGAVTNNGQGMAGTSWNCRIMPVCAGDLTHDNSITYGFQGIQYAAANGARVINCSWGRTGGTGNYSQMEQDVITAATQAGALVVAAAGNDHLQDFDNVPFYPAAYQHVLSVGATTDTSDAIAYFTNYGANVSVFAPGMRIHVALNDGSYGTDQGTSFSSPLVAGLAGLLAAAHPDWKPDQIAEQIRMTADPIDGSNPGYAGSLGHGRVNFGRALAETHAGVEIISSSLHTPSGRAFILVGDTLVLSAVVQNILGAAAHNLSFSASSTDPALQLLQGSATIAELDSGQQISLPDFKFKVGSLFAAQRDVLMRLDWVSNVNERDARTFRTTASDSTDFWYPQTSPTTAELRSVKALTSGVVWAAGGDYVNGAVVVRTTDGGSTWTNVTGNMPPPLVIYCITATDANHAWVGTATGTIFGTSDGGVSWSQQAYPGSQSPFIAGIWFFDVNNGYALGDPAIGGRFLMLQTTNGGASWTHFPNEPVGSINEYTFYTSFWWTDPNHGWFGTNDNRVWRTTDAGGTWSSSPSGGTNSLTVSFSDTLTGLVGHGDGTLARSTDGGATWVVIPSPTTSNIIGISFPPGSASAGLIDGARPYRTDDNGSSWRPQASTISGGLTYISFSDSTNGWIVANAGKIIHSSHPEVTAVPQSSPPRLPEKYALEQNYPNPFNPSTWIRFSILSQENVTLKVYSVLGQEVATLVNGVIPPGAHEVRFDALLLASGVYFYRLEAGKFVETKKLLLLR